VDLAELMLRDAQGAAIPPDALDETFLQLARQAHGRPAILRLCACVDADLKLTHIWRLCRPKIDLGVLLALPTF
jgi:hypothetical protein